MQMKQSDDEQLAPGARPDIEDPSEELPQSPSEPLPRSLMEVCSFKSNNGQTMETMADIKIIDLEQQISELKAEMMKLKLENDQLKTTNIEIQKNQSNETKSQLNNKITTINTNDQLVQTDPIPLTIEQKTIVRYVWFFMINFNNHSIIFEEN